jgi:Protein kinase domain
VNVVFPEGHILDDTYRLIRIIGEGGMGAVYEATHARLAGRYAIKVLLPKDSEDPEAIARFHREAQITSLLRHPNIVQVVDYNTASDGTAYLAMEFVAGESLAERLYREGPPPIETVATIIDQIAAGLAAAHAHGIVHSDLKPDNVFLTSAEGRAGESVKILDFGVAKTTDPKWDLHLPDGVVVGTPQYMSPEQAEGRHSDVDAATDQFALAAISYELVTGRNPFQADTIGVVFSRILRCDPGPTGLGRDLDLVLRRGLAKSNRQRFPCVEDFSGAFRAAVTHQAPESQQLAGADAAGGISDLGRNRGARRRSRGMSWGVVLAASIVMSFMVGWVETFLSARAAEVVWTNGNTRHLTFRPVIVPLPRPVVPDPLPVASGMGPSQGCRAPVSARVRGANRLPPVDDDATMPLEGVLAGSDPASPARRSANRRPSHLRP